ncbi:MAG: polyprenyl synthetase family protein [Planctomycetota bacterium]|jgi:octaprenyl-diphosphate synthase
MITHPKQLEDVIRPVAKDLQRVEELVRKSYETPHPFLSEIVEHMAKLSGKKLRPILVLLAARAAGEVNEKHHRLGHAIELVHTATLIHDDLLDGSELRRKMQTINARWGIDAAILLGDYLFSEAFRVSTTIDGAELAGELAAITNSISVGELRQTMCKYNADLTEEEYFDIIRRKTALLYAAACYYGARYGGDAEHAESYRVFGEKVGIAFQIIDDLLDIVGTEAEMGKTLGTDLALGKMTLPIIHLLGTSPAEAYRGIAQRLAPPINGEDRAFLSRAARENGSIDYAKECAARLIDEAKSELSFLPPSEARDSLFTVADFCIARRV